MHISSTSVNSAFTGVAERPASHAAAAVFLGTSIYVAHEGLAKWAPGNLGNALTALFVAVAVLQWTAGARKADCEDARDDERASAVMAQAWRFGVIEASLFAAGGLALSGLALNAWSIGLALAGGALFAYSSFRVKWTSCDPLKRRKSPPSDGGQRVHDVLFSEPVRDLPALAAPEGENVVAFDLERAIRHKGEQERSLLGDIKAACSADGDAARRLQLATKRLQTRHRRATKRTTIAA